MFRTRPASPDRKAVYSLLIAFCLLLAGSAGAGITSRVDGEALIAARPAEPSSYEMYAEFLLESGAPEEAAEVLEKGRAKAAPSAHLLVTLGIAYEKQGLLGRAEAVTREALAVDPDHARAHMRMGDLYFRLGWPKSGLESYREAVRLAPADPAPQVKLVAGCLEAGQTDQAEDACLEFISRSPEQPDLWLSLGQVFEKQGKQREAFTTYGQVLSMDPQNAQAFARQGRLFCQFGQFTSAEAACRQSLKIDPDNSLAHAYLGIALSYLGNDEEARKHAQIAEKAGLNMVSVWKKISQ